MSAIYKKEMRSYFNNLESYIFTAVLLAVTGLFVKLINFNYLFPKFEYILSNVSFVFILIVPVITMRAIAEEKHAKTDQLLYSLPITTAKIVISKFLALYTVFLIPIAVMSLYPILLSFFGKVSFAAAYSSLFGFMLMSGALLAVGFFLSSVTESQVIAALLSLGAMLVFILAGVFIPLISSNASTSFWAFTIIVILLGVVIYLMTKDWWISGIAAMILETSLILLYNNFQTAFEGLFGKVLSWVSVIDRFSSFQYGIFDIKAIVYYLSIIVTFVFLTVQSMEKRRWS